MSSLSNNVHFSGSQSVYGESKFGLVTLVNASFVSTKSTFIMPFSKLKLGIYTIQIDNKQERIVHWKAKLLKNLKSV